MMRTFIAVIIILFVVLFARASFIKYFNRNVEIYVSDCDSCIYSPAFGKIVLIDRENGHLCIFLSPMDVHRQYFPFSGNVVSVEHDMNGRFSLAYKLEKSDHNEKVIHTLKSDGPCPITIRVTQIAGSLARQITYTHKPGDAFTAGEEMGMIHLGSRVDMYIPIHSGSFDPDLHVGQKIRAGDVIAFKQSGTSCPPYSLQ